MIALAWCCKKIDEVKNMESVVEIEEDGGIGNTTSRLSSLTLLLVPNQRRFGVEVRRASHFVCFPGVSNWMGEEVEGESSCTSLLIQRIPLQRERALDNSSRRKD